MLVQNNSPFRYNTFNAPCQITQVAGILYSEEGEKYFYLALSTLLHQECKTGWLQEDNYKDNTPQSQEHFCGFSWPVTSSAQMQSSCASPTQRHVSFVPSQTHQGNAQACNPEWRSCRKTGAARIPVMMFMGPQSIPSQIYGNLPQ